MTNIKTTTTTKANHYFGAALAVLAMLAAMLLASGVALAATTTATGLSIQIRDNTTASGYPTTVFFQNVSGQITDVNLILDGYKHAFPDDVDVLLEGPQGQKALLMSDVGGSTDVFTRLALDDDASTSIPDSGPITSTVYKPTQGTNTTSTGETQGSAVPDNFPASAPPGPYAKNLSAFDGTNPNGLWKLYVIDDSPGDSGAVQNGWLLQISTATTPPPDTIAPKVTAVSPQPGATNVDPATNVAATFSEDMKASTVNGTTFKLFKKGTTTKVGAAVGYDASAAKATLDPTNPLKRGVTYKAVVSTGAKDLAGNALDQNATKTGNQQKVWSFTVRQ